MPRIAYCLAALLLLATMSASALTGKWFRPHVVFVDAATKSIKFRVPGFAAECPLWKLHSNWCQAGALSDVTQRILR